MMRRKPTKECLNPECGKEFDDYKSAKKEYCSTECKNRANYLKSLTENKHRINHSRDIKKNEKILDRLVHDGLSVVKSEVLEAMNFNFNLMYNKNEEEDQVSFELGKYSIIFSVSDPGNFLIQNLL